MARLADPDLAERRRRQIMDAALACFRRRGFHQATMQEICATAEISAGALYHYFASKAEIIGAIAEDGTRRRRCGVSTRSGANGLIEAMCEVAGEFFSKVTVAGEGALIADIMAEVDPRRRHCQCSCVRPMRTACTRWSCGA